MKVRTEYVTEDDKTFYDESEALRHENEYLSNALKLAMAHTHQKSSKGTVGGIGIEDIPTKPGIYMWTNPFDGFKKYIGSADNLRFRAGTFISFNIYQYGGTKINEARQKYNDPKYWQFSILRLCPKEQFKAWESYFIDALDAIDGGYNGVLPCGYTDEHYSIKKPFGIPTVCEGGKKPTEMEALYGKFCSLWYIKMLPDRVRRDEFSLDKFEKALNRLNATYSPGLTSITFRIKAVRNRDNTAGGLDNMSIVPKYTASRINTSSPTVLDKDGIPTTSVFFNKKTNTYAYKFSCMAYTSDKIQTYKDGFRTRKDAFAGLLMAKTELLRESVRNDRALVDSETMGIISTLTIGEAERLFYWKNDESKANRCFYGKAEGLIAA